MVSVGSAVLTRWIDRYGTTPERCTEFQVSKHAIVRPIQGNGAADANWVIAGAPENTPENVDANCGMRYSCATLHESHDWWRTSDPAATALLGDGWVEVQPQEPGKTHATPVIVTVGETEIDVRLAPLQLSPVDRRTATRAFPASSWLPRCRSLHASLSPRRLACAASNARPMLTSPGSRCSKRVTSRRCGNRRTNRWSNTAWPPDDAFIAAGPSDARGVLRLLAERGVELLG